MGISRSSKSEMPVEERGCWHGPSNTRISITNRLRQLRPLGLFTPSLPVPEDPLPPGHSLEESGMERSLPGFISIFLPEFPHRKLPGQDHFQVLGFIAKGSFGPILKVKDKFKENTFAVKVLPKSEILKRGVLEQSKEEVSIQCVNTAAQETCTHTGY